MPEIVIIGGGIIGLCTAYYLLESGASVTIVENSSIACAASSKAAGFIGGGAGWHQPPSVELARLSFNAFSDLAKRYDGPNTFGWNLCATTGVKVGATDKMSAYRQLPVSSVPQATDGKAPWANGELVPLSNDMAAQMMPHEFCALIHEKCTAMGLRTLIATPVSRTKSVLRTTGGDVPFDRLVIAAGPWTPDVCETLGLPRAPVSCLPGHSIQIKPALPKGYTELPYEALFCGIGDVGDVLQTIGAAGIPDYEAGSWERTQGWTTTVEFFPRSDGNVYGAGENAVPASIGDAEIDARKYRLPPTGAQLGDCVDKELVQRMLRSAKAVSHALDVENGAELVKADLCFRPVTDDKMPLIGEWADGVYICAGHGPWGITLAPGSGVVMAEILLADMSNRKAKLSADISGLSPHRFGTGRAAKL